MQYSASVQFYHGSYSCEVVDLFITRSAFTTKIIPRVEIRQENLSITELQNIPWSFAEIQVPAMNSSNFDIKPDRAFKN